MRVQLGLEVKLPIVPNFIVLEGEGSIPVAAMSDEDLERIGKEWTAALRNKGREARNRPDLAGRSAWVPTQEGEPIEARP